MTPTDTVLVAAQALLETVREAGIDGAPSGPMYMAVQHIGIDLATYQHIMDTLVRNGKITHSNHVYYPVQGG